MSRSWTCDRVGCGAVMRVLGAVAEVEMRVQPADDSGRKLAVRTEVDLCPDCLAGLRAYLAGACVIDPPLYAGGVS